MGFGADEQVHDVCILLSESSAEDFQGILQSCAATKIAWGSSGVSVVEGKREEKCPQEQVVTLAGDPEASVASMGTWGDVQGLWIQGWVPLLMMHSSSPSPPLLQGPSTAC